MSTHCRFHFLVLFLLSISLVQAEPLVSPDAKLEKLFESKVLTEGVAVAPDGMVYFSEITFSHMARDDKGVIEAGHIWKYDPSTGKSYIIAGMYENRPFNSPNDIAVDEKGRIYFSDPRYLGHEGIDQPLVGVYRIDPDGKIERIISDAGKANGVAVSPDQKSLYVVSNENGATALERLGKSTKQADKVLTPTRKGLMALQAYDLAADGTAKFRKVLVDYSPYDGPDGLTVDAAGNLWVAVRAENRPGICVYSPDGKELTYIKTEVPTNVGFARGPDSNLLYITAGSSLYRIRTNTQGYHLPPAN